MESRSLPGPCVLRLREGQLPSRRPGLQRASSPSSGARGVRGGAGPHLGQAGPAVRPSVPQTALPAHTVRVDGCGRVPIKLYLHRQAEGQLCPAGSSLSAPGPPDLGTLGLPERGGRGRGTETRSAPQRAHRGLACLGTGSARTRGSLSLGRRGNGDQGSHGGTPNLGTEAGGHVARPLGDPCSPEPAEVPGASQSHRGPGFPAGCRARRVGPQSRSRIGPPGRGGLPELPSAPLGGTPKGGTQVAPWGLQHPLKPQRHQLLCAQERPVLNRLKPELSGPQRGEVRVGSPGTGGWVPQPPLSRSCSPQGLPAPSLARPCPGAGVYPSPPCPVPRGLLALCS